MRRRLVDRVQARYGIGEGPLAPLRVGLVLWGRNLLPLTGFALVPALGGLVFEWLVLSGLGDSGMAAEDARRVAAIAAGLLTFPLAYGATAATYLLLDARVRADEPDTPAANFYGRGLKLFGRLFGVFFMMGLVLLVPLVPAAVTWQLDLLAAAVPLAAIAIGFDVWLLVRWSMAAPVAVLEDATFSVAFARSKQLVRGAWWRAFAPLSIIALATGAISVGIWQAAGTIGDAAGSDGSTAQALANLVIGIAATPPLDCVVFTAFAALSDRKRAGRSPDGE